MARGISPIVAVVLLIAIAIIAACGLFFWTAGVATKQPVAATPVSITAVPLGAGKVLIANLGTSEITGGLQSSEGILNCDYPIPPGEQVLCDLTGTGNGSVVVYGATTGAVVVETSVVGDCSPCTNGQACDGYGDCVSGFCGGTVCAPCANDSNCQSGQTCGGGACASCGPSCPNGVACSSYSECASKYCSGTCAACAKHADCPIGYNCIAGSCIPFNPPVCAPGGFIASCPCTLNVVGSYGLNTDLAATDTCVTMTATGSAIDCQGHSITGPGPGAGYGIYLSSIGGSEVSNCRVSRFWRGIFGDYGHGNTYDSNTLTANGYGLVPFYSSSNTITNNNISANAYGGFQTSISGSNNLSGNTLCFNPLDNHMSCEDDQVDGGGNICTPAGGKQCSDSVTCNAGCPALPEQEITSCGTTINTPGYYYLTTNLTAADTCITVNVLGGGSVIDCQGHAITGPGLTGARGIYLYAPYGVNITNCVISGFSYGIQGLYSPGNKVYGNTLTGNGYGLGISFSGGWTVTNNTMSASAYSGFQTGLASGTVFTNNRLCWNPGNYHMSCESGQVDGGGNICSPAGSTQCLGSIACNAGCPPLPTQEITTCGVTLSSPKYYYLSGNLVSADNCITVDAFGGGSVVDCQGHSITGPGWGYGVRLFGASSSNVTRCTIKSFTRGIAGEYSPNGIFDSNTLTNNEMGMAVSYVGGYTIVNNNASANYIGFVTGMASGSTLTNNIFCANTAAPTSCENGQLDGGSNVCAPPGVNNTCSNSITCNAGC